MFYKALILFIGLFKIVYYLIFKWSKKAKSSYSTSHNIQSFIYKKCDQKQEKKNEPFK